MNNNAIVNYRAVSQHVHISAVNSRRSLTYLYKNSIIVKGIFQVIKIHEKFKFDMMSMKPLRNLKKKIQIYNSEADSLIIY